MSKSPNNQENSYHVDNTSDDGKIVRSSQVYVLVSADFSNHGTEIFKLDGEVDFVHLRQIPHMLWAESCVTGNA